MTSKDKIMCLANLNLLACVAFSLQKTPLFSVGEWRHLHKAAVAAAAPPHD